MLLDTHTFLWFLEGSQRIPQHVRAAIEDSGNPAYLSIVSVWEISIKVGLGKLDAPRDVSSWLPAELEAQLLGLLPLRLQHATAVEHLPFHHRDPFDRLLIAQAIAEGLLLVTADRRFELYPVQLLRY